LSDFGLKNSLFFSLAWHYVFCLKRSIVFRINIVYPNTAEAISGCGHTMKSHSNFRSEMGMDNQSFRSEIRCMFQGLGAQLQQKILGLPHWVETMQFFQNVGAKSLQ